MKKTDEEWSFLKVLHDLEPLCLKGDASSMRLVNDTRRVFADWLEDHDQDELSALYRLMADHNVRPHLTKELWAINGQCRARLLHVNDLISLIQVTALVSKSTIIDSYRTRSWYIERYDFYHPMLAVGKEIAIVTVASRQSEAYYRQADKMTAGMAIRREDGSIAVGLDRMSAIHSKAWPERFVSRCKKLNYPSYCSESLTAWANLH